MTQPPARRDLPLTHGHDGRDLEMTAAGKMPGHLRTLHGSGRAS